MATLKRYGWNKRTALVIMLLLVFASLSVGSAGRAKAYAAPCCAFTVIVNYYSDDTHTTLVGRCIDSECTGFSCTGEQTDFFTTRVSCCQLCGGV